MEFRSCPRKHAQESRPATGSLLCTVCLRQVERSLRTLPGLHQECLHHISPTSRQMHPTKVSGSRKRDHLNVSVLDARQNLLVVLESWSGLVVEKLGVVAPTRSVPHLARFLLRHLDWLAAQPPAADFADEIETLTVELMRVFDPDGGDRRTIVAECVVDDCTGVINASPQGTGPSGRSSISCSSGHSWEIREWLILRKLMDRKETSVGA